MTASPASAERCRGCAGEAGAARGDGCPRATAAALDAITKEWNAAREEIHPPGGPLTRTPEATRRDGTRAAAGISAGRARARHRAARGPAYPQFGTRVG